ncbi:hypothetical protein ACFV2B_12195 [Streptomyces lavendulae]|uniref:hypothetical protein n=1 Tax=Streptomyces lavendulae TaxID=1914 RepID=UPI0036AB154C
MVRLPVLDAADQLAQRLGGVGEVRGFGAFRFDSRDMKDPLRDTVLAAGWTWRGVLLKW